MTTTARPTGSVGHLVRGWRRHRRRSQLDVAVAADVSARHLSFVETGRATPSPAMIERICDELEVPLRERNALHLAAGYAPPHRERPYDDLGVARAAVEAVLRGHEPNPALAVDVQWDLMAANRAMQAFLEPVPPSLRLPRLNVLRATLHPDGLAPVIRNYRQWREHVVRRVRRQLERTAAPGLAALLDEVRAYPVPPGAEVEAAMPGGADLVMPLLVAGSDGDLSLLYATTVFGSPRDVTLDEIAIETFFPADERTAELLTRVDLK